MRVPNFILVSGLLCSMTFGEIVLEIPESEDLSPHLEQLAGRAVFFVDGLPFVALAVEIPWRKVIYGRHSETISRYDYLYPAAKKMDLNTLKVPVKWSLVEPKKGVFDFSYVDHAKAMAEKHRLKLVLGWFGHYASGDGTIYRNLTSEVFVPMDIIEDVGTYPRAVDAEGNPHHNVASYDYEPIIQRETAAFRAFMEHIRKVDSEDRTILMIQVENEIAVFGSDRQNPKLWRDHSPASNRIFEEGGFEDDLIYSAQRFSEVWIRRVSDAGKKAYPLPFFLNFVGGKVADWMVGGAPGEHVPFYLENCPNIDFVGLNSYLSADSSSNDLRARLDRYKVGRNLPSITETNSGNDPVAPRFAYLSIGEFGSPLFAPWALNTSYPSRYEPYVRSDGSLANGAFALRACYSSLNRALPLVAAYGGTEKAAVFMAKRPGQPFQQWKELGGLRVTISGTDNGQAIVVNPQPHDYFVIGYKCSATLNHPSFEWPAIKNIRAEQGYFQNRFWVGRDAETYTVNQSRNTLRVSLPEPRVVRIRW